MSKILDKIKSFGHSLTSMFQENEEDDVSYLDPNTEDGKKLAEEMKPFVDRLNALEAKRNKEQKQYQDRLNRLREGESVDSRDSSVIQNPTQVIKRGEKNSTKSMQQTRVPKDRGEREE